MPASFHYRKLTVEEVFAEFRIFCDAYSLLSKCDIAKIDVELPIDEFVDLCDGAANWTDVFPYFGLSLAESRWNVCKPPRCLRELCVDIASALRIPVNDPLIVLGKSCETAGMFLMLKRLLSDSGADTSKMTPSSPIEDFARHDPLLFCRIRLARLGRLPEPWFIPRTDGWQIGVSIGIIIALLSYAVAPLAPLSILLGLLIGGCAKLFSDGFLNPYNRFAVGFLGIVTFRDFIHAVFDRPETRSTTP